MGQQWYLNEQNEQKIIIIVTKKKSTQAKLKECEETEQHD